MLAVLDGDQHLTIHKVGMNEPLTASDMAELERMLAESGVGGAGELQRAVEEAHGLGLFVRSLVGLERDAAKRALAGFLSGRVNQAGEAQEGEVGFHGGRREVGGQLGQQLGPVGQHAVAGECVLHPGGERAGGLRGGLSGHRSPAARAPWR